MGRALTVGGGGHWWSQSRPGLSLLGCYCRTAIREAASWKTVRYSFDFLGLASKVLAGLPAGMNFWVWPLNDGQGPCIQQGIGARGQGVPKYPGI